MRLSLLSALIAEYEDAKALTAGMINVIEVIEVINVIDVIDVIDANTVIPRFAIFRYIAICSAPFRSLPLSSPMFCYLPSAPAKIMPLAGT
ncbi:MAG: hypothetical protein ACRC6D_01405 [Aeromonas sp.]